jgi:hypothetical protein
MNLIGFKREHKEAFCLRLRGSCGTSWPQLSHPSATSTKGHRPRNTHQGFSPLQNIACWNDYLEGQSLSPCPVLLEILDSNTGVTPGISFNSHEQVLLETENS